MEFVFPSNLLINNKKKQRLETAEIEISLTKKALTEIDQFQKNGKIQPLYQPAFLNNIFRKIHLIRLKHLPQIS